MRLVAWVADSTGAALVTAAAVSVAVAVAVAGALAGAIGCMPRNPYTAARSWVMASARSAKTAANWVATGPSGVAPPAISARADSRLVCCTALSSVACSPWRVCDGRSSRTLRTVTEVALD